MGFLENETRRSVLTLREKTDPSKSVLLPSGYVRQTPTTARPSTEEVRIKKNRCWSGVDIT